MVPKYVMNYLERVDMEPVFLNQDDLVEVPEVVQVPAITEIPKPEVVTQTKRVPKYSLRANEVLEEVEVIAREERIVEVPETRYCKVVKEVMREDIRIVEKRVPVVEFQEVERAVEVPVALQREVPVPVPQTQKVEVIREEPKTTTQTVEKKIAKPVIEYVEKTIPVPIKTGGEVAVAQASSTGGAHRVTSSVRDRPSEEIVVKYMGAREGERAHTEVVGERLRRTVADDLRMRNERESEYVESPNSLSSPKTVILSPTKSLRGGDLATTNYTWQSSRPFSAEVFTPSD